ncbi:hypothetical protein [Sphingomonas crocodyli]|uniref:Uncharacterized protein n=1 Tax=Sphingomonas crocodyli TaxID=1979270 RepID=A0A437M7N3_9SPHN|nr:hypothetical protein [Sphingomonas crocodyli]RVT93623.1 hypothetical protein EOD43_07075 [Sphingomonas crocodyli]
MPYLLWEVWTDEEGFEEFTLVSEASDKRIADCFPALKRTLSIYASSSFEARRIYGRMSVDEEWVPPDGIEDQIVTDADAAHQADYLARRDVG